MPTVKIAPDRPDHFYSTALTTNASQKCKLQNKNIWASTLFVLTPCRLCPIAKTRYQTFTAMEHRYDKSSVSIFISSGLCLFLPLLRARYSKGTEAFHSVESEEKSSRRVLTSFRHSELLCPPCHFEFERRHPQREDYAQFVHLVSIYFTCFFALLVTLNLNDGILKEKIMHNWCI